MDIEIDRERLEKVQVTLKMKLFNPKKKRPALYKLCPDDIDEDKWKGIVKYWKS